MKKVTAVICELNPLHNGHKYLMERAGEDSDVLVLVMSGSFSERGTPAIYDKYTRAEAAVRCGANLVLELPFPWSTSGTESFAIGGVAVAAAVGATRLVFGSETGDAALLEKASEIRKSEEFAEKFRIEDRENREVGSGELFDRVMESCGINEKFGPNDKLGMEYIRFGRDAGIDEYKAVKRADALSASEIRAEVFSDGIDCAVEDIPEEAYGVFEEADICSEKEYDRILFQWARLNQAHSSDLIRYASSVAKKSKTPEEFIKNLPTKKYTLARLRRELISAMAGVSPDPKTKPEYTYLLAADKVGREYLSKIKKNIGITLITKPADAEEGLTSNQRNAEEVFELAMGKESGWLIKQKPFMINL